ncbi:GGDEF domain-containing protein [Deinobacterium chartae]|uniref:GGDEF domain-containing protein n=1 Tax=Deinobacterium chartae TaxID=521158 RepID=A0A841I2V1_9DEIO|nr:GGDEF domain-containing protein [Deinobacterium chartae]MBB6100151.1 GGDEF domain-containing protein [Deinobacterium chartae]
MISDLRDRWPLLLLLAALCLFGFETALDRARGLWLLAFMAGALGTFVRPTRAAGLGWVLLLVAVAYLAVTTWLGLSGGDSWVVLLVIPWLPVLASNVQAALLNLESRGERAEKLLEAHLSVHPVTGLPGEGLAVQLFSTLQATLQRLNHGGAVYRLQLTNLALVRELNEPAEVEETLRATAQALRDTARASDWLFHTTDDTFVLLADLGDQVSPEAGAFVLSQRLHRAVTDLKRVEVDVRYALIEPGTTTMPLLDPSADGSASGHARS